MSSWYMYIIYLMGYREFDAEDEKVYYFDFFFHLFQCKLISTKGQKVMPVDETG